MDEDAAQLAEFLQLLDRHRPAWQLRAACRGMGPALFVEPANADRARAVCAVCPVTEPCRELGDRFNSVGTWGGHTNDERKRLRRAARLAASGRAIIGDIGVEAILSHPPDTIDEWSEPARSAAAG